MFDVTNNEDLLAFEMIDDDLNFINNSYLSFELHKNNILCNNLGNYLTFNTSCNLKFTNKNELSYILKTYHL